MQREQRKINIKWWGVAKIATAPFAGSPQASVHRKSVSVNNYLTVASDEL